MNCFVHASPAVGTCSVCSKAMCRECVGRDEPRLICRTCLARGVVFGFEFKSRAQIGSWPLVHVCTGLDPTTMRPKVARGVIAIGNLAVGGLAAGGIAVGVVAFGGLSVGILLALGGLAAGIGISAGGLAIGSVAMGGMAVGLRYAFGGLAIAPDAIGGNACSDAARAFWNRWLPQGMPLPSCFP